MIERKSYGQFCGLARSLDHVGDRWTLLIVRELLLDDRTFRDLEGALDGISPSLLTKRLRELTEDGIVSRNGAPTRSKQVAYSLTAAGRSLEPVVLEIIRWGARWMMEGPGSDRVDPRWAPLALRAILDGESPSRGHLHLDVDGIPVTVGTRDGQRYVTTGHHGQPDATVTASLPTVLAVAAGAQPLRGSDVEVDGDTRIATDLLDGAGNVRARHQDPGHRLSKTQ